MTLKTSETQETEPDGTEEPSNQGDISYISAVGSIGRSATLGCAKLWKRGRYPIAAVSFLILVVQPAAAQDLASELWTTIVCNSFVTTGIVLFFVGWFAYLGADAANDFLRSRKQSGKANKNSQADAQQLTNSAIQSGFGAMLSPALFTLLTVAVFPDCFTGSLQTILPAAGGGGEAGALLVVFGSSSVGTSLSHIKHRLLDRLSD